VSAFYYAGSFLINFGNYLFHLILIRLLEPARYGEFLTYVSFLYLLAIPSTTISIFVTHRISYYYGKNQKTLINTLFHYLLKKTFPPFLIVSIITILFSSAFASLFKAHPLAFIVLGVNVLLSLFSSIIRSYNTAYHQFNFLTIIGIFETILKIVLVCVLVRFGFGASSGLISIFVSSVLGLWFCFQKIKHSILPKIITKNIPKFTLKDILTSSLIFSSCTLSLISLDILLVRYYFDPHSSGIYSGISMIGRMIFYGIAPITGLLLPIATKKYSSNKNTWSIFYKLGITTFLLGGIGATIFSLKPLLVVSLLSGPAYRESYELLIPMSFSMFIFGLNYFLLTYLIAINQNKANMLLAIFAILQPFFIIIKHQTIRQVVEINLIIQIMMLISLYIYLKNVNHIKSTLHEKS
jgi:O-antigen/teichoic acid export membrane protein